MFWLRAVYLLSNVNIPMQKINAINIGHDLFTQMDQQHKKIVTSAIDLGTLRFYGRKTELDLM